MATILVWSAVIAFIIWVGFPFKIPVYNPKDAKRDFEALKADINKANSEGLLNYYEKTCIPMYCRDYTGMISSRQMKIYCGELHMAAKNKRAELRQPAGFSQAISKISLQ